MLLLQQAKDIQSLKLLMSNGCDAGVKLLLGQLVGDLDAIFMLHNGGVGPWVIDSDIEVVLLQSLVDVDDLGVAYVGAVLFESEAKDEDI